MYIKIKTCQGSTNQLPHRLVSAEPTRDSFFILTPQAFTDCGGDILSYMKNRMDPLSPIRKGRISCNRPTCEGNQDYREVTVSLPVILVLECMPESAGEGQTHDTQKKEAGKKQVEHKPWALRQFMPIPGLKEDGSDSTEYYDIVGRMYYDASHPHFFAHVRFGLSHCLLYDDKKQGIVMNMTQNRPVETFLSGSGFTKDNVSTSYVVYHLRQGRAAQERISRRLWRDLNSKHHVLLTLSGVDGFPVVNLTGPGEVTQKSECTSAREVFVESEIDPTASTSGTQAGTKDTMADKPSEKVWPFPHVEHDGSESDIPLVHAEDVCAAGPNETVKKRKKSTNRQSLPSSMDKSADTVNFFRCRCGFQGEVVDGDLDQNVICCDAFGLDDCNRWSHVACQPDGWTAFLASNGNFYCPLCEEGPGQG